MWNTPSRPSPGQPESSTSPDDEVAGRAISFAARYGTPLSPAVYEVWYIYAARANQAINEKLDLALNTGRPLDAEYLLNLYQEHLSTRSVSDELDMLGSSLVSAMGNVADAMDENMQHNSLFSGTLRNAKRSLVQGTSKHELSDLIKQLHKANQQHLQAAQRMNMQLDKSRAQVAKLKGELIELRRASNTDYLTGLPNRRMLDELLDQAIFDARQRKQELALLMGVIDNLEPVSRKFGLSTGDTIMRRFADQLRQDLRSSQMAARFAGAKFAIVLPDQNNRDSFIVAEYARKRFRQIEWVAKDSGQAIGTLSVSFGGAMLRDGDTRDSLIDRANAHLLKAQAEGSDRSFIQ